MTKLAHFLCAAVLIQNAGVKPRIEPRTVDWAEMSRNTFDPRWILPDDLPLSVDESPGPRWDLVRKLKGLSTLVVDSAGDDSNPLRCLGDVVREVRAEGNDARARDKVRVRLKSTQPKLFAELQPFLDEILCDKALHSNKWDPDDDAACDGLFFAPPLTIENRSDVPWKKLGGSDLLQQACALVDADLEAIKAAENDYSAYRARPGSKYEAIYPVDKSFVRGVDAQGRDFSALRLFFRCDLPFPFSTYECDLHVLNRVDASGAFVCDIYSTSKDFYWLAGRDVFMPVKTSDGVWVGTLIVRLFGFDVDGVPDGDEDRRTALRASLGSLKRESEAIFRASGSKPRTIEGRVPAFDVLGRK